MNVFVLLFYIYINKINISRVFFLFLFCPADSATVATVPLADIFMIY